MSLTTTEVFGFADAVNQAMSNNQAELLTKGVTVGPWITAGTALKTDATAKNQAQEDAKTALKDRTTETNAALQATYDFYSSKLDAMASAYGKTSEKGKQLLKLRSNIRRGGSDPTPPPPTP